MALINYIFTYLVKRTKEKATLEQPILCLTFLSDYSISTHSNISSKRVCAMAHTNWETLHPGITYALCVLWHMQGQETLHPGLTHALCVLDTYKAGKHYRLHGMFTLPPGPVHACVPNCLHPRGATPLVYVRAELQRCGLYRLYTWPPAVILPLCGPRAKTHSPSKSEHCLLPKDPVPTQGLWKALGLGKISRNILMTSGELKLRVKKHNMKPFVCLLLLSQ